jgi:hypothetical protein
MLAQVEFAKFESPAWLSHFHSLPPEFRLAKGLSKFLLKQLDSHVF